MKIDTHHRTGLVERPVPRKWHAGCGKRPRRNGSTERRNRAPGRLHRIQKDLGCLSLDEYEATWYTTPIDADSPATIHPELALAS
jgi:hypothetical protein